MAKAVTAKRLLRAIKQGVKHENKYQPLVKFSGDRKKGGDVIMRGGDKIGSIDIIQGGAMKGIEFPSKIMYRGNLTGRGMPPLFMDVPGSDSKSLAKMMRMIRTHVKGGRSAVKGTKRDKAQPIFTGKATGRRQGNLFGRKKKPSAPAKTRKRMYTRRKPRKQGRLL